MMWTSTCPSHVDPAESGSDFPTRQVPDLLGHLVKEGVCQLCSRRIGEMGIIPLPGMTQQRIALIDAARKPCTEQCKAHGIRICVPCINSNAIPWKVWHP